jgi:hypothetical protein
MAGKIIAGGNDDSRLLLLEGQMSAVQIASIFVDRLRCRSFIVRHAGSITYPTQG